jgi:hypothetical protein
MHMARRILTIAFEEWHSRIPDYRIPDDQRPTQHYSPVRGLNGLPLLLG